MFTIGYNSLVSNTLPAMSSNHRSARPTKTWGNYPGSRSVKPITKFFYNGRLSWDQILMVASRLKNFLNQVEAIKDAALRGCNNLAGLI